MFTPLAMLTILFLSNNGLTCTGDNYTTWGISSTVDTDGVEFSYS